MQTRTLGALVFVLSLPFAVFGQTPPQGSQVPGPTGQRPPLPGAPTRDARPPAKGTARIEGRIVAADTGNPIVHAQIRLTAADVAVLQTTLTDTDGRYKFSDLPAARYSMSVSRSGYVTLQYGQQRAFEPGRPLTLTDGQIAEKTDFALPRGSVIAGKVTDEFGEPLAGASLQALRYTYQPGGQRRLTPAIVGFSTFASDDRGEFRVYGLMPGTYLLSAMPPRSFAMTMIASNGQIMTPTTVGDRADANDGYATTYYPGTANTEEAQSITLGVGQEASAFFSLIPARLAKISGIVRNSQGRPVERAIISLRTSVNGGMSMSMGANTAADGSFTIASVAPGDHVLDVRAGLAMSPGDASAAQEFAAVPVSIQGQDVSGLMITTGTGGTVSGRVIFEGTSARPTPSQMFRVVPSPADPNANPLAFTSGGNMNNGLVDESGNFQFTGVSGRMLLRVAAPGWFLKSVALNNEDVTDSPVDVKANGTMTGFDIRVTDKVATLSGIARDSRGAAVKDFVAIVLPADAKEGFAATRFIRVARPDNNGKYQVRGLPPGEYVGVAVTSLEQGNEWDPAFQQVVKPRGKAFKLAEGQTLEFDLPLFQ